MEYLVNSRQMKMADQYTIQEKGVLSLTLMERDVYKRQVYRSV